MPEEDYIDVMDDPTYCCDYWRRCNNKVIKEHIADLGGYNIGWSESMKDEFIINVLEKWEKTYKKNEDDI